MYSFFSIATALVNSLICNHHYNVEVYLRLVRILDLYTSLSAIHNFGVIMGFYIVFHQPITEAS